MSDAVEVERAPAKINLHLHVTGRRADGYHTLDSLVVFATGASDRIEARAAAAFSLAIDGPFGAGLSAGDDNLVLRAARALGGGAAALRLRKELPVASGIGGGSADAAAALRALARLRGIDPTVVRALAVGLGADVPVCLAGRPATMRGIGEILLPAPRLPPFALLLVNAGVPVSTQDVFRLARRDRDFRPDAALPDGWDTADAMARDLARLTVNDLEAPARVLAPAIGDVLGRLGDTAGCLLARMSGSGGTCFGIYRTLGEAEAAASSLRNTGWWRAASEI